jgi:hypothetical protein
MRDWTDTRRSGGDCTEFCGVNDVCMMFPSEPTDIGVSGMAEYGLYGVEESVFGEFESASAVAAESSEKPHC